jgi:hypothetical protein
MRAGLLLAVLGAVAVVAYSWSGSEPRRAQASTAAVHGEPTPEAAPAPELVAPEREIADVAEGDAREEAVVRPERTWTVRGRLVAPNGEPLGRVTRLALSARLAERRDTPPTPEGTRVVTDSDSQFEVEFEIWKRGHDPRWFVLGLYGFENDGWVSAPLPPDVDGGDVDLGTLQLHPSPLVAAGVVLSCLGDPVEYARVAQVPKGKSVDELGWMMSMELTDDEGRFELRGWTDARVRLAASSNDRLRELKTVDRGADDVELILPGGVVRGSVRLEDGHSYHGLDVRVTGEGARYYSTYVGRDGQFELVDLPPESLALFLRSNDVGAELWKGEVRVQDGQLVTLPEIDLRGRFRAFEVRVVDQARNPVGNAVVRPDPMTPGHFRDSTTTDKLGRTEIVLCDSSASEFEVRVTSHSHRRKRFTIRDPLTEVVLGSTVPVRLFVTGLPVLPKSYRLGVHAHSVVDASSGVGLGAVGRFVSPREVSLQLPSDGEWELRWNLRRFHSGGPTTLVLATDEPPIHVADEVEEQVIHVRAPAHAIAEGVRTLETE